MQLGKKTLLAVLAGAIAACAPTLSEDSQQSPTNFERSMATSAAELLADGSAIAIARSVSTGEISAEAMATQVVRRIQELDRSGPSYRAVLAINPNLMAEARLLDEQIKAGSKTGLLLGVPVLIKDNIDVRGMPTTAGSLALARNMRIEDSPVVARLRAAGALIIGKANMSEWANFRGRRAPAGWSAVGGQTLNAIDEERSPCGSSSGSAVAVATGIVPIAIGTETNGSIICPAAANGVVGAKPAVGSVPTEGVVPLAPSFDAVGAIGRRASDVRLVLAVIGDDSGDQLNVPPPRARLEGLRIGAFRWAEGDDVEISSNFNRFLEALKAAGASMVEIEEFDPSPNLWRDGMPVMEWEFKSSITSYLEGAQLSGGPKTLAELIEFNLANADIELSIFGQEIFLSALERPDASDRETAAMRDALFKAAREDGIDALLSSNSVELIVMPSGPPPRFRDPERNQRPRGRPIGAGWLPSLAGYPHMTIPMGMADGMPVGLSLFTAPASQDQMLDVGIVLQRNINTAQAQNNALKADRSERAEIEIRE
ncbi:amidase family protein [uncultured Erythrobacter sp.]|uniref:amidase family protein n=1 Tax=uncultured Erythrobacter sp. TaxID=263913 RepID=UPI0026060C98|nr:amidase family protein [uncultured Erythrobacter sp.]